MESINELLYCFGPSLNNRKNTLVQVRNARSVAIPIPPVESAISDPDPFLSKEKAGARRQDGPAYNPGAKVFNVT
jgi:hypothetical protein